MSLDIPRADEYVSLNVLDREDWQAADDDHKTSFLTVASTTLKRKFKKYDVPDTAVFHFGAILALVFNDTNKFQQHGIAGFSVTGVASFTFKENNVKTPGGLPIADLIPIEVYDLISEANGVDLTPRRRSGRTVL